MERLAHSQVVQLGTREAGSVVNAPGPYQKSNGGEGNTCRTACGTAILYHQDLGCPKNMKADKRSARAADLGS